MAGEEDGRPRGVVGDCKGTAEIDMVESVVDKSLLSWRGYRTHLSGRTVISECVLARISWYRCEPSSYANPYSARL